ncbi:hematopoietic death receptor isoform X1 [Synchiropus splendidus]|uniref:hematopoietic death receptor isoform X1 n=1 Tax=Synchiropus splendidus TaxID=270530 RepID=UPI00237D3BFC|nr:hematopoietic death receptor isoform X1 [Synchiropus splendidus]
MVSLNGGFLHDGDAMISERRSAVIFLMALLILCTVAFPHEGPDPMADRVRRDGQCGGNEHKDNNKCCRLCPAGQRLVSSCVKDGGVATCEECDSGTYMDHPNYEKKCLTCTNCRDDQEAVTKCTHTQDAVCRCKVGKFCPDDHPCEVCRTCSKCGPGETVARNCSATSDTECKKISPPPDSNAAVLGVVVPLVLLCLVIVVTYCCCKKKEGRCDCLSISQKPGPGDEEAPPVRVRSEKSDVYQAFLESPSCSASSSQHSIAALLLQPQIEQPLLLRAQTPVPPVLVSYEEFPQLTPTNGPESLRKCFAYFEDLDLKCYPRFFRGLGLHENDIISKETLHFRDQMSALLNIWLESNGKNASLNQLLAVLLELHQRQTAETIKKLALESGHFVVEEKEL